VRLKLKPLLGRHSRAGLTKRNFGTKAKECQRQFKRTRVAVKGVETVGLVERFIRLNVIFWLFVSYGVFERRNRPALAVSISPRTSTSAPNYYRNPKAESPKAEWRLQTSGHCEFFVRALPPHPNPLPWGEGESAAGSNARAA
jgi:hypothetical protein